MNEIHLGPSSKISDFVKAFKIIYNENEVSFSDNSIKLANGYSIEWLPVAWTILPLPIICLYVCIQFGLNIAFAIAISLIIFAVCCWFFKIKKHDEFIELNTSGFIIYIMKDEKKIVKKKVHLDELTRLRIVYDFDLEMGETQIPTIWRTGNSISFWKHSNYIHGEYIVFLFGILKAWGYFSSTLENRWYPMDIYINNEFINSLDDLSFRFESENHFQSQIDTRIVLKY